MVQNPKNRLLYEKVRHMRERGYTYNEIQGKLRTSKGNISLWCRDIRPAGKYFERLQRKHKIHASSFQKLAVEANKKKYAREREQIREAASQEIRKLERETFRIAGAMIYWAEGSKSNGTCIANSDPNVIVFMVRWFSTIFNIHPDRLKAHLHIHYGNDDLKIKEYWSELTGIPLQNFGKSFIKPKGTGHRTHILPNGIIKIRVSGTGVEQLRRRILAWTEKVHSLTDQYTRP